MPAIAAGARRRAEWAAPRSVLPFMMRGFSAAADGGAGGEEGGAGVAPAAGQEAEVVENSADVESAAAASELGADEAEVEQVEAKASVGLSEADSLAATFGKGPRPGLDDGEGGWTEDETVPVVHNSYPGVKLPPTRTGKDWQAQLHFKAFDANVIDYASAYVRHIAAVLGVRTGNVVPLPKKTKLFTVLRSPHVHKKSREQFHMMTYKRLICIYDSAPENLDVFYEELQARPPVGVLIKIKDRRKIEMPVAAP
ncbi:ribosomal protein S10p/S20e-domain-containing protein [Baffinella frigidus]|nr:ribosomal protein S10p/S20e-domain-containing protein [Cryptophyta sp. CCMP2293]